LKRNNVFGKILLGLILILSCLMVCSSASAESQPPAPPLQAPDFILILNDIEAGHYYPSVAVSPENAGSCVAFVEEEIEGDFSLAFNCIRVSPEAGILRSYPHDSVFPGQTSQRVFQPSLAFNPVTRMPGIAYIQEFNLDDTIHLYYAFQEPGDEFDEWQIEEVDSFDWDGETYAFFEAVFPVSLAFQSDGTACIAYHQENADVNRYLNYACRQGDDNWTIEENLNGSFDSSIKEALTLAFDSNDKPFIVLNTRLASLLEEGDGVRVFEKNGSWTYSDIDTGDLIVHGYGNDLIIDENDNPVVVFPTELYESVNNFYIVFAQYDGAEWNIEPLANANNPLNFPNLIYFDNLEFFNNDEYGDYLIIFRDSSENVFQAWKQFGNWYHSEKFSNASTGLSAALHGNFVWLAGSEANGTTVWVISHLTRGGWSRPNDNVIHEATEAGYYPHVQYVLDYQPRIIGDEFRIHTDVTGRAIYVDKSGPEEDDIWYTYTDRRGEFMPEGQRKTIFGTLTLTGVVSSCRKANP
jgi:hypothetical protein